MIGPFDNEYRWLSNFYPSKVVFGGKEYKSVEHAFQAAKTLDDKDREWIASAIHPGEAKKRGKCVILREDWEDVKDDVMWVCLQSKFSNIALKKKLLNTGDEELVEVNWWKDRYWGVCDGVGENKLGKLLMRLREELRNDRSSGGLCHGA